MLLTIYVVVSVLCVLVNIAGLIWQCAGLIWQCRQFTKVDAHSTKRFSLYLIIIGSLLVSFLIFLILFTLSLLGSLFNLL